VGAHQSHLTEYLTHRVSISNFVKGVFHWVWARLGSAWLAGLRSFLCVAFVLRYKGFLSCICGVSRSLDKILSVYSLFLSVFVLYLAGLNKWEIGSSLRCCIGAEQSKSGVGCYVQADDDGEEKSSVVDFTAKVAYLAGVFHSVFISPDHLVGFGIAVEMVCFFSGGAEIWKGWTDLGECCLCN